MTTQKESERFADIDRIFAPRNIAIVGVSSEGFGFGRGMLLSHIAIGCKCKMYPVNKKGGSIAGMTIYPSIEDIPDTIDFAIIAVPAHLVPSAVRPAGKKAPWVLKYFHPVSGKPALRKGLPWRRSCRPLPNAVSG